MDMAGVHATFLAEAIVERLEGNGRRADGVLRPTTSAATRTGSSSTSTRSASRRTCASWRTEAESYFAHGRRGPSGERANRLAAARRAGGARRRARPEHAADPGHEPRGGDHTARAGAEKLWAGTVVIHPKAKTGAHHHGPVESVIYVVSGRARMRWGDRLEFTAEAGPGDFIYVPPYVPHQEINASPTRAVLRRASQRPGAGRRQPRSGRRRAEPRASALGGQHPPGALNGGSGHEARVGSRHGSCPSAAVGSAQNVARRSCGGRAAKDVRGPGAAPPAQRGSAAVGGLARHRSRRRSACRPNRAEGGRPAGDDGMHARVAGRRLGMELRGRRDLDAPRPGRPCKIPRRVGDLIPKDKGPKIPSWPFPSPGSGALAQAPAQARRDLQARPALPALPQAAAGEAAGRRSSPGRRLLQLRRAVRAQPAGRAGGRHDRGGSLDARAGDRAPAGGSDAAGQAGPPRIVRGHGRPEPAALEAAGAGRQRGAGGEGARGARDGLRRRRGTTAIHAAAARRARVRCEPGRARRVRPADRKVAAACLRNAPPEPRPFKLQTRLGTSTE